jgi:phosphate:Na+ symporter
LFYPLIEPFIWVVRHTSGDIARQIANAHTIFNVGMALIFLPFTGLATKVVSRLFREEAERERPFGPIYLDESGLQTPALALGYVTRELVRMARIVQEMAVKVQKVYENKDPDLAEEILKEDDKVDILNRAIKFYMARLNKATFSHEQSQRELELVSNAADLEIMGDIITQSIVPAAKRYIQSGLGFSPEGMAEIRDFHARVMKCFDTAMASFETGDEILSRQVMREKEELSSLETHLKETHLERLHKGYQESFKTSTIHLEYLSNLRRISTLAARFSKGVLAREDGDHRLDKVML